MNKEAGVKGTALVTGGARRIGLAIACTLAENGWDIALHYRNSEKEAKEAVRRIESAGQRCSLFQADFGQMKEVSGLVENVHRHFPDLCLLVNSVSLFERARFMETDETLFDRHFQINLKSPFFLTQHFAAFCRKGNVVNILDTKVSKHLTAYFAYTLTKKSLMEFTSMAALELGPEIRVNAVAPGLILPSSGMSVPSFEAMGKKIPAQRTGTPEDIARAVLFLVQNDFITGVTLYVDGGEHLGTWRRSDDHQN